jgi:hypothetical protein
MGKKNTSIWLEMPITELFEDKKRMMMHFGKLSHVYSVKHLRWPDNTPVSSLLLPPRLFSRLQCTVLTDSDIVRPTEEGRKEGLVYLSILHALFPLLLLLAM